MTIYIMGGARTAFTVGMARCAQRDANLPFIAVAPSAEVAAELPNNAVTQVIEDQSEIDTIVETFNRHGAVMFIDTPRAADHILDMVDALFAIAHSTTWTDRIETKEVVN